MTPAVEDLAMVVGLAILTEDRSDAEQAALLRVARMVDEQIAPPGCSLENQAVVTWDEDVSYVTMPTVTTPGAMPEWTKGGS